MSEVNTADLRTIFFVISSISLVVQYILIKILEDEESKQEGTYYKIILKIKKKHNFIGSIIQILFFFSIASLFVMFLLSLFK